jgi:hypothetical protein
MNDPLGNSILDPHRSDTSEKPVMLLLSRRMPLATVIAVALWSVGVRPAPAQYYYRSAPGAGLNYPQAVSQANAFRAGTNYGSSLPYSYYPGYGESAYGGFLRGNADVINSSGNYLIQNQQANLVKQQVEQAKIDTRRKNFDEWMYEQANTPTTEDLREKARIEQIRRSRFDPPVTEIWSGKALNDLFFDLRKLQGAGGTGPTVPLDPDMVKQLNVTPGGNNANFGLLKDAGKLKWPLALKANTFNAGRQQMDQLAPLALQQARTGEVDADTLNSLISTVDGLEAQLKDNVANISANEYIASLRYLRQLEDSVKALQDPKVNNYINGKWQAKGDTVAQLVTNMTQDGLQFAPAVSGQQAAYTSVYRAMADYDTQLSSMMGRPTPAAVPK